MKISNFRPVPVGDVPEAPSDARWMDSYMRPRDRQMKKLTQLEQKFASLPDNFNADVRTVGFKHNTALELGVNVQGGVLGVSVIDSAVDDFLPRVKLTRVSDSRVSLTMKWDSDPGGTNNVTFIVWGR